jgi:hypothetical protein
MARLRRRPARRSSRSGAAATTPRVRDGQFDFADPPGKQRRAAERDKNPDVIKPGAVPGVAA